MMEHTPILAHHDHELFSHCITLKSLSCVVAPGLFGCQALDFCRKLQKKPWNIDPLISLSQIIIKDYKGFLGRFDLRLTFTLLPFILKFFLIVLIF